MQPKTLEELKTIAPLVGRIYAPKDAPDERIYVESVEFIEPDEDMDAGFFVEGCTPGDQGDMGAMGYEIHSDEWIEHSYILIP